MKRFTFPKMAISLPLAIAAALLLLFINESGHQRSRAAVQLIGETQDMRGAIHTLLRQMLDAESGQRGYLLTGDIRYLEPYEKAVLQVNHSLDALRALYLQRPEELSDFSPLSRHVSRKLAEMDLSVRLRKQDNEDAWKFVLMTDVGKEHMDAIRQQSDRLIARSAERMDEAQSQVERSLRYSRIGIALFALVALLLFVGFLRKSRALELAGARQQEALERERDRLEALVRERTQTLGELATHLQQVREEERGHLARELHDELGSLLTAAKLDVARLKSKLGQQQQAEVADRIQHLTETLNSGIALKRRIIEDLRPSSLSNLGLVASLEILVREFGDRSGLEVHSDLQAVALSDEAQLTVYRLVQESLTNVGKYAEARQVSVVLKDYAAHAEVEVRDDGRGFDPAATGSTHGLAGMRHRVEALGGRLTVGSADGRGTLIAASIPKPR